MSDIQVSLFGTAMHVEHWPEFFAQFEKNTVKYEIILAGPRQPNFKLPDNVKFIHRYPDPGPGPCSQTAANFCQGETMFLFGDDCIYSPDFLDRMYDTYKKENNYKALALARWCGANGQRAADRHDQLTQENDITEKFWEITMVAGRSDLRWGFPLRSKQLWDELGGFDRRFVGAPEDSDWILRAYNAGAYYKYAYDAFMSEPLGGEGRAWNKWHGMDEINRLMWARWYSNGQFTGGTLLPEPRTPFEPYPKGELPQNTTWFLVGDTYVYAG